MTIENNAVQVRGIAFIDLEASGLGSASFPTEIGWAIIRDHGSLESGSCLVRPPAKWHAGAIIAHETHTKSPNRTFAPKCTEIRVAETNDQLSRSRKIPIIPNIPFRTDRRPPLG
jgi:hypothetical protein